MDYESIGLELDSIIEEVKSKKIKLSEKDIKVIDEIISKLDEQKLRRKDEERNVELLNKLEEIVQVTSGNKVISEDSSQKIIEAIQNLKIETPVVNVAAPEVSVEVEKPEIPPLPPINIPETVFPSEMGIRKPLWIDNLINLNPVILAIKGLKSAIESIKLDLPRNANDPLSVRLSDGEKFYKYLGGFASSISSILTFRNSANESQAALVDSDGHNQIDVLSSALPDGGSTSANQETSNGLLTDIKANQTNETQITKLLDSWGDEIGATMIDEMMVSQKNRLCGGVFNGTTPDTNFYTTAVNANGTATISNSILDCATTTDSGSSSMVYTNSIGRYIGGNMNHLRGIFRVGDTGVTNNTRMIGCTATSTLADSFYFQLSGTTFSIVANTTGLSQIKIDNGSFNGDNLSYTIDDNFHTWEILFTNKSISFYIDKVHIHTLTETTSPICGTRHLRPFMKNINTGVGSVTHLYTQSLTMFTWGETHTQSKSHYHEGQTTGILLKTGIGSLHGLVISGIVNNANVDIYDGLTTAGTKIWSSGAMSNQTVPFVVNFNTGDQFSTGLYIVKNGANCNTKLFYE